MSAPRLEACYFPSPRDARWKRLARALQASAWQACPGWDVQVRPITPTRAESSIGLYSHVANTQKLDHWAETVNAADDGEQVLLVDTDTVVLQPLDDLWALPFDLAYTTRPRGFPFNAGVIAVRVSDRVRTFMADWADANRALLGADKANAYAAARTYGGINQASLAPLLQHASERGITLRALPCAEWNCEDTTWAEFDPARTRILHVKSALRTMALSMERPSSELAPLVAVWRRFERLEIRHTRSA